jgi:hypothetical protein
VSQRNARSTISDDAETFDLELDEPLPVDMNTARNNGGNQM